MSVATESPAVAVGAYVRGIRSSRLRAYAIAYLDHLLDPAGPAHTTGKEFPSAPSGLGEECRRIREEISRLLGPPVLKVVPPEPATGIAGWTECAEHGWVREPHKHETAPVPGRKRRIGPLRYSCGICGTRGPKFHAHENGPPLLKRSQMLIWLRANSAEVHDEDQFEVYTGEGFCYRIRVRCWMSFQTNAYAYGEDPHFENCRLKFKHDGGCDASGITQAAA